MDMDYIHLFVYGTLRKNEVNHNYLLDARLVAEQAWTNGRMVDTGQGYPTVILSEIQTEKVYGELYELPLQQLPVIDELEGCVKDEENPSLYVRSEVSVHTDQGEHQAFIYTHRKQLIEQHEIEASDWRLYQLRKKAPTHFYYFAYGSCMDNERFIQARVGHLFENIVGVGVLKGYQMGYYFYAPDGNRADIVEGDGETEGIVYQLPLEAIDYLFDREGVTAGHYRPTFISVTINDVQYEDVLTFHVYDKKPEAAPPVFYANEILRSARGKLSRQYVCHLEKKIKELGINNYNEV